MKKAAIITGGAKRIGAAIARHFASNGYDIALHYNTSKTEAVALQKEIRTPGVDCQLFQQDLQKIPSLDPLIQKIHATMPHCTALINNASLFERATFMETDEALFDRQFTANFKAPFFLSQSFARHFAKGSIINLLDTDIAHTQGSHFAYLLSKKSLAEFTMMAARALGPHIRVNGVCPGIMLPSNELDEAYIEKLSKSLPLGQVGLVEQAASSCLWLCENSFVTGQFLFCDGGQHLL